MQPEPCDDPNSCSLRIVSQVVRLEYVLRAGKAQEGRFTFRFTSETNKTGEKRLPFLSLERMNERPPRSGLKPPLWNMRPVSSPNACLLSRERIPSPPTHRQHDPFCRKNNRFRHFASPLDGLCVSGRHERVKCTKLYEKGTHVASDYVLGTDPTGLDRNGRASPWHRDMDTLLKLSKMKKSEKKGQRPRKKK